MSVDTSSMDSDKEDHPYPYFGLRECGHLEVCHDPLECSEFNKMAMALEILLTKLLNPPFKPKKRSG